MATPFQMSGPSNTGAGFSDYIRKEMAFRKAMDSPTARANREAVTGNPLPLADQKLGYFPSDWSSERERSWFYRNRSPEQRAEGQARKFQAGLARQKEINAGNFPVKPQYGRMGTMGPSRLASRESQAATGKPMGSMAGMLASRASQAVKPQVAAQPGQPKTYGADFMGPVPTGGVREAGLLPSPVLDEQTGARWSGGGASPAKPPGRGFAAYLDEQMGGTGWKMSTRDSQAGFVAQDGPNRGETRQAITSAARAKFLGMSPEERAKYDEQAEVLSGVAGRPDA